MSTSLKQKLGIAAIALGVGFILLLLFRNGKLNGALAAADKLPVVGAGH